MSRATIDRLTAGVTTPSQLLRLCMEGGLGTHPFLARGDGDLRHVYLLFRHAPFKDNQPRLMTAMIESTPDAEIRALLLGQLAAETGGGDVEKSHLAMQDAFLRGLAPWATDEGAAIMAAAKQTMDDGLERLLTSRVPLRALGGYLAGEVSFGCHMAQFIIRTTRARAGDLGGGAGAWVAEHEVVEDGHQHEALRCCAIVERDHAAHVAGFLDGGREMLSLMWAYFSALDAVPLAPVG